ncbi:MAG: tRNA-binding protein [Bacteroidetes bacterium]|nr:tRNA-binding protein [Bacteroidota bacterium]
MERKSIIDYSTFEEVDIRVGRIIDVSPFPEARKPAYQLTIDFGPQLGVLHSSAQITTRYSRELLLGRLIVAVVNFLPKRIAGYSSEVLVLGVANSEGEVVLLAPDSDVLPGSPIY